MFTGRCAPCYNKHRNKGGRTMEFVNALDYPRETSALFREYTEMLVAGDAVFASYLELQRFDEELLHLEEKDGAPEGCL